MKRCIKCGMPDTRPGSIFTDGICQACINYENRSSIDYDERWKELKQICSDQKKKGGQYDCVVAVSGGKDSTVIVSELDKLEMKMLLVTVADEFTKTKAGEHNINNIAERFNCDHIIFRCEPQTFRRETLRDFEKELHPLKWIEEKIYTKPIEIARNFGIDIVFFGENSAYEYGTESELKIYHPLSDGVVDVLYFFAFCPYDEFGNMHKAREYGFLDLDDFEEWPRQGNIENFTQIDSIAYIVQLWTKYPKYGFQRVCDMTSRLVRKGIMSKEKADMLVSERDHILDPMAKWDFCGRIGITESYFDTIVDKHVNKDIMRKDLIGRWRVK